MNRRPERVAEMLRAELSDLMLFEVKDPRVRLASISEVRLTGDLQRARVLVSVLAEGEDEAQLHEQRRQVIEALDHARGFLRSQLAKRTRLRVAPELIFELDRGAEHSQRINEILETLHAGDETT